MCECVCVGGGVDRDRERRETERKSETERDCISSFSHCTSPVNPKCHADLGRHFSFKLPHMAGNNKSLREV